MGGFFVNSILNRDGFLLGGVVIVYCVLLVGLNFVTDIAYRLLDPRLCNWHETDDCSPAAGDRS